MRHILQAYKADFVPIADLITYSPLPTHSVDQIDPFLLLNHHGPQTYPAPNNGLPFGPHPHRGMETVTFILDGDISHKDSGGHESVMTAGGVQWMTAGRGLIHAEVSSDAFKANGGKLEILQLWLNLPARLKMTEPFYKGLQKEDIPKVTEDDGNVTVEVIAGKWGDTESAFQPATNVQINLMHFKSGGKLDLSVSLTHNILFYVIRGGLEVNGQQVAALHLAVFDNNAADISITALEDSILLLGHALPFNEPVVSRGPFVMNTEAEIAEAYNDYRMGKFGTWKE